MRNKANNNITWYSTSHIILTLNQIVLAITSWLSIRIIMMITWIGSHRYQFYKSLVWLDHGFKSHDLPLARPVLYRFGHHARSYNYEYMNMWYVCTRKFRSHLNMYIAIYIYIYIYYRGHLYTYVSVLIYMCVYIYICVYIYLYMYIYT